LTSRAREHSIRRTLAVEDGPFSKKDSHCLLLGVVTTDNSIEKILLDRIHVDGTDATSKVISLAHRAGSVDLILLPSISLGGFNIVDPEGVHQATKLPILVTNPVKPDLRAVRKALRTHFADWKKRVTVFDRMGSPKALRITRREVIYFYCVGFPLSAAVASLRNAVRFGKRPEPLRIARIIARALGHSTPVEALRSV